MIKMANKKGFKDAGADLFFSASDAPAEAAIRMEDEPEEGGRYAEILSNIKPDELPGGNCTFYLERKIIDSILLTAKEMGISRSKLVNRILAQVLAGKHPQA